MRYFCAFVSAFNLFVYMIPGETHWMVDAINLTSALLTGLLAIMPSDPK